MKHPLPVIDPEMDKYAGHIFPVDNSENLCYVYKRQLLRTFLPYMIKGVFRP